MLSKRELFPKSRYGITRIRSMGRSQTSSQPKSSPFMWILYTNTHCQGNITQMLIKFSRLKIQYVVYYNIVTDRRKFYENDKRHIFKNHKIYIENYQ